MEWDDRGKVLTVKIRDNRGGFERRKIRFSGPVLPFPGGYEIKVEDVPPAPRKPRAKQTA